MNKKKKKKKKNCLLYGVNKVFLHRLQIVQNSAARVILKMRKYDHISRARQELHWLPIQQRIAFSILTDVYKALHGLAPTYITDLISLAQPARLTRSSKNFNIAFPVKVPRKLWKTGFCSCCSSSVEQSTC